MDRKKLMALALVLALLCGLLSGCREETVEETPATLDLDIALVGDFATLDPAACTTDGEKTVLEHLYENLMTVDAQGETVPAAAAEYTKTDNFDGTVTYTFSLRQEARWSDGVVLTAADFVYAWRRLADPATDSPNAGLLSMVQGYEAVRAGEGVEQLAVSVTEEGDFQVILGSQCPWFLSQICTAAATMPLRENVVAQMDEAARVAAEEAALLAGEGDADGSAIPPLDWQAQADLTVGNGAYKLDAWDSGSIRLTASERHHTPKSLGPDTLTFRLGLTAEEATALFENQKVDFAAALDDAAVAAALAVSEESDGEEAAPAPALRAAGETWAVFFNNSIGTFESAPVREAFSLSVDRNAIAALRGAGALPAGGLVPYGVSADTETGEDFRTFCGDFFSVDPAEYALNCAMAQKALEVAGYPGGVGFPAVEFCYVEGDAAAAAMVEALCGQWAEVLGVTVSPRAMAPAEYDAALASGQYDLACGLLKAAYDDPMTFLRRWTSDHSENVLYYLNTAYDVLTRVIEAAGDESARTAYIYDLELLLLEDYAIAPLCYEGYLPAVREDLRGVVDRKFGVYTFHTAFVAPAESQTEK